MTILPYKGKSIFDAAVVYAPYVPLQFAKQAIIVNSIKLVYDNPDFNPRIRFRPRHCVRIDPSSRVSSLTKLKFFRDAIKWCKDNAGNIDTDWVVDGNHDRVWFREQKSVVLFKLTFDGFDKT
ncbi:hypothetical protein D3C87_1069680 [compost metagenome]